MLALQNLTLLGAPLQAPLTDAEIDQLSSRIAELQGSQEGPAPLAVQVFRTIWYERDRKRVAVSAIGKGASPAGIERSRQAAGPGVWRATSASTKIAIGVGVVALLGVTGGMLYAVTRGGR